MSPTKSVARKWTCDGCGVSAGRIDNEPVRLPGSWDNSAEGLFCLVCRRQRAADAALAGAPSDSPVGARAKLRRAALIEFEVSRTPDHADGVIARACRTSVSAVTRARRNLQLPDPPLPSAASRRAKSASR
ncbi:MAG TPA: hypothetical protein VHR65_06905 [Solirubrobacterales bacterium]|jgi:hypothetical protein|nr:hypothetical protein [Solirubrobacterales bacterium]